MAALRLWVPTCSRSCRRTQGTSARDYVLAYGHQGVVAVLQGAGVGCGGKPGLRESSEVDLDGLCLPGPCPASLMRAWMGWMGALRRLPRRQSEPSTLLSR